MCIMRWENHKQIQLPVKTIGKLEYQNRKIQKIFCKKENACLIDGRQRVRKKDELKCKSKSAGESISIKRNRFAVGMYSCA